MLHRHNLAYALLRSDRHAEAKAINDALLAFCETDGGIKVVGKKLHLIMLNLQILIMRMADDAWRNEEAVLALYDRVFRETYANYGVHDIDTWIALNNRIGSLKSWHSRLANLAPSAPSMTRWSYVRESGSMRRISIFPSRTTGCRADRHIPRIATSG